MMLTWTAHSTAVIPPYFLCMLLGIVRMSNVVQVRYTIAMRGLRARCNPLLAIVYPIHIAPKVGIFHEAGGRGKYSLPRVKYMPAFHRVEYLVYYIGYSLPRVQYMPAFHKNIYFIT